MSCPPGHLLPVTVLVSSSIFSAITKTPAIQDKRDFALVFNVPRHYLRSFLLLLLLILAEQPVEYVYSSLLFTKRKKYQAANNIPVYSQMVLTIKPWPQSTRDSWCCHWTNCGRSWMVLMECFCQNQRKPFSCCCRLEYWNLYMLFAIFCGVLSF